MKIEMGIKTYFAVDQQNHNGKDTKIVHKRTKSQINQSENRNDQL